MHVYGKSVAVIESTDDDKFGPNGGFTAVLSTPSLDRDGDRLARDEWLALPDRLPLDIDHGMTVADTVGSFHPYWDGEQMMMDAYFSSIPSAQNTRTLVTEGHIRSVSVAFMTDKSKKDGEPRRELLNAGIVAIPSNRDAVILASKAYSALKDAIPAVPEEQRAEIFASEGEGTGEEIKALLDALIPEEPDAETKAPQGQSAGSGDRAMLQAIHDASVHMGAVCVIPLQGDDTGSSDGANKSTDEVETKEADEPDELAAFEKQLDEVLTEESPAESPAEEEPAPAEEAAAASEEAADEAADELALQAEATRLRLSNLLIP